MATEKIHIDLVLNTKGFRPLGRINGQLGEFEKSLDASNARVLAFGASAGAILAVKKAFTATVKAAIEVEKSLTDINVILGATSANLRKFGSDLFEIASKTGQAFSVAAVAATELARQGLGTAETLKRTRDALILARLAGMDAAEAVNALTAAINTFNKAGLDSTTIINKLANVDAAFAVSSDDLAKAISRVGASAKSAGVNFDQLLAIVTTVQQKTARGGAVIGNSFKTIFTRIQRPRVIKQLEQLGIAVRNVEGEVLPAMKVLQNLARQFNFLGQAQKAQVTEMIGGVFQVNILKAAMSDLSKETGIYSRALGVSIGSSDQALRRNEELNKTLSAQFQRTVNTFKEGAAELGELTLGPALERMFGFVDDMSKIGDSDFGKTGVAIAKSIFEGLGKFISGPGLLVIGLVLFKTFSQLGKFAADAFKTLTGLNKNLQTQQNLQRQVFDVLSENPDLLKKIKDGTMTVEDAHEEIFKQIQKNTSALDGQLLVSQQLAKSLVTSGVGFSTDFGATSGGDSRKFGSAGYIPSFAADRGERLGMMSGGYSDSQIRNPKTRRETIHDGRGKMFDATVNGHESVFTTQNRKGKKATFVVPPKNSEAYDKYMSVLSGGFVPSFMAFARLKKGTDFNKAGPGSGKTLGPGQASFTGKGEEKVFKALDGRAGTTLMLKDGSAVVSDRPLHGMAAMEAGIDPRKIVGGGFHSVRKGKLSFGESDMTDLDELDKVLSGGFRPNFGFLSRRSLSDASSVGFGQSRKFGNKPSLKDKASEAVTKAGQHPVGRIVADAAASFTTGAAKGLPLVAFIADMAALHGPEIAKAIKRKIQGGKFFKGYGKGTRLESGGMGMGGAIPLHGGHVPNHAGFFGGLSGNVLNRRKGALEIFNKEYPSLVGDDRKAMRQELGPVLGRELVKVDSEKALRAAIKGKIRSAEFRHGEDVPEESKFQTGGGGFAKVVGGRKRILGKGNKEIFAKNHQIYDAKGRWGALGLYGGGDTDAGYAEAPISGIAAFNDRNAKGLEKVGFTNLQYRTLTNNLKDSDQVQDFSQMVRSNFAGPTQKLARQVSNKMLGGRLKPAKIGATGSALFSKDAEGVIFEQVANALTSTQAAFEKGLDTASNKTWDFHIGKSGTGAFGQNPNTFRKSFRFTEGLLSADAKRTLGEKSDKSMVNKIFNTKGNYPWQKDLQNLPKKKEKGKAGGYIPNFNALFEAVRREKEAGVPSGRIRVGRSERLKNGQNPSGFGIYNTRDEPMGIGQGINNSIAAGIDPKKRGKLSRAGGFIPNFMIDPTIIKREEEKVKTERERTEKTGEETKRNTKAIRKQTDSAMGTMVMMGLLQQGISGLNNSVDENNNRTKAVINALGSVAQAMIAAKFLGSQIKDSGMGKLSGARKEAVESGRLNLGTALSRENRKQFHMDTVADEKEFGKGKVPRARRAKNRMAFAKRGISGGAAGMAASGALTGVVGGLAALSAFGKMMTESDMSASFKEARLAGKSLKKIKEATEKNISKLNRFGNAAEQAAKTFEDENATMSQVLDASRKMEEEMSKLPAQFRAKLGGIFDPKKVNTMIEAMIHQEQKRVEGAKERKDAADLMEEVRSRRTWDIVSSPGQAITNRLTTGNWAGLTAEDDKMQVKDTKAVVDSMIEGALSKNKGKFEGADMDDLMMRLGGARTPAEKVKVGKELGLNDEDMQIWSKWMHEGGDAAQLMVTQMAKSATQMHADLKTAARMKPIREALLKQNREQIKAQKELKRTLESEQRIRTEVMKITAAGAKSFLNSWGKIKLDTAIKLGEAEAEKATQFGSVVKMGQSALGAATANTREGGVGIDFAKDIRATFSQALAGGIGSVSEQRVDKQTSKLDTMIEAIKSGNDAEDPLVIQQLKELEDLKKELQNIHGTSERLAGELKLQTKELRASALANKLVAEQQRRIKSFGGPQALLDPSKMNPMFAKITSGGKAMAAANRSGSATGFNRGRINQLSGIQDLFGGELPAALQQEAVQRATQVGVKQISAVNKALGLGMSQKDIQKTAAEQAANLFKGDPQKMNTKALESLTVAIESLDGMVDSAARDQVTLGAGQDMIEMDNAARQVAFAKYRKGASAINRADALSQEQVMGHMQDLRAETKTDPVGYAVRQAHSIPYMIATQLGLLSEDKSVAEMYKQGEMSNQELMDYRESQGKKPGSGVSEEQRQKNEQWMDKTESDIIQEFQLPLPPPVTINFTSNGTVTSDGTPSLASINAAIGGLLQVQGQLKNGMIDAGFGPNLNRVGAPTTSDMYG